MRACPLLGCYRTITLSIFLKKMIASAVTPTAQTINLASGPVTVDTGFIVYNERTYPNLTALFKHIGIDTASSDMSFSASLEDGEQEYSGQGLRGLFARPLNASQLPISQDACRNSPLL